jgi:hypothetical protein
MKTLRKNRIVILIIMLPILLLGNAYAFTLTMELIREASDISVIIGVLCLSAFAVVDYFVIKFIQSLFKTKTKKQKS